MAARPARPWRKQGKSQRPTKISLLRLPTPDAAGEGRMISDPRHTNMVRPAWLKLALEEAIVRWARVLEVVAPIRKTLDANPLNMEIVS